MDIKVERKWPKETYTIGNLYINGKYFSNTLEDRVRPKGAKKVAGETAIPAGEYELTFDFSPKFSKKAGYQSFIKEGKMPHILGVKGFERILIHSGNHNGDTAGCILVGKNTLKGYLTESLATFEKLYRIMYIAFSNGEEIKLTIE